MKGAQAPWQAAASGAPLREPVPHPGTLPACLPLPPPLLLRCLPTVATRVNTTSARLSSWSGSESSVLSSSWRGVRRGAARWGASAKSELSRPRMSVLSR